MRIFVPPDMPLRNGRYRYVIRCLGPKLGPTGLSPHQPGAAAASTHVPYRISLTALIRDKAHLRLDEIASAAILTSLDPDGAADVIAVP